MACLAERPPGTAALERLAAESSEDCFRAVFGGGRSSSLRIEEGLRFPSPEDHASCLVLGFTNTSHYLHHLRVEDDKAPFLWVTDGQGQEYGNVLYCASHDLWHKDAAQQLPLLGQALRVERTRGENDDYELEWTAASSQTSTFLLLSATSKGHVRLVRSGGLRVRFWGPEEMKKDPARVWDEIADGLTRQS